MKRQTLILVLSIAFLAVCFSSLHAQVTIGADDAPNPSAALDIRSNINHGLLLPRVVLTDTLIAAPLIGHVKGMFVYNTTGSADGKVREGIYYNDGRRWWNTTDDAGANGNLVGEPWYKINSSAPATLNTQNIYHGGKVGIGAIYASGVDTLGMSMLEVDGASTNKNSIEDSNDNTIDFTKSNFVYTTAGIASAGTTFTLQGLKDGGTYTLGVKGTSSAGIARFEQSGMTFYYVNNETVPADKHALYTIVVMDSNAYVWMAQVSIEKELPPIPDIANSPYLWVGAFWKANQKGERLIRQSNTGSWEAKVIEPATNSWIVLDRNLTTDPNVGWLPGADESKVHNGNDSFTNNPNINSPENFETLHPVNSTLTSVSGTGTIYFRIGLTGTIGATEHRYGIVELTYNNGQKQNIYIRQGEYPDVLFSGRTNARQFSPYNLTYDNDPWTVGAGTTYTNHPQVGQGAGVFVDYPTQAGAFFQWANGTANFQRRAYHPTTPGLNPINIANWPVTGTPNTWSATGNETCPSGYRRPNDGSTTAQEGGSNTASEMRQSLYASPPSGVTAYNDNSVFGYYADGFFDRRKIVSFSSGTFVSVPASVSIGNSMIAYIGVLFYNANTNASLFFPTAGERIAISSQEGQLVGTAGGGFYWSSSSQNTTNNNAWVLYVSNINRNQLGTGKYIGASIRCVLQ
jgi:hypothetical protein